MFFFCSRQKRDVYRVETTWMASMLYACDRNVYSTYGRTFCIPKKATKWNAASIYHEILKRKIAETKFTRNFLSHWQDICRVAGDGFFSLTIFFLSFFFDSFCFACVVFLVWRQDIWEQHQFYYYPINTWKCDRRLKDNNHHPVHINVIKSNN